MTALLLVLALALLTIGAELLVGGASSAAARLRLSPLFIGLTIVGFGTSTPELSTGIAAAIGDRPDINVGNVVGSNICNIALILGLAAFIAPVSVASRHVRGEAFILVAVAPVPLLALLSGEITRVLGVAMILVLVGYVWCGYVKGRAEATHEPAPSIKGHRVGVAIAMMLVAIGLLTVGSHYLVKSASDIARWAGVSELTIALTIVAVGTSTPELFTSVVAAIRRRSDIALGNVIGSNIFNILGILGVTALIRPQHVSQQIYVFDMPVMIGLSAALLVMAMKGNVVGRRVGVALIIAYVAYIAVLVALAMRGP